MRRWLGFLTVVVALVGIGVVLALGHPLDRALNILVGAVFSGWGLIVLTLPWDLHFEAVHVLRELDLSLARGMHPEADRRELVTIVRRTRLVAVGSHLVSAIAIAVFAWWSTWPEVGWVALAFGASTFFRPLGSWYLHLRARLRATLGEVRHPREDAIELRGRVEALEATVRRLEGAQQEAGAAHRRLEGELQAASERLDRRLDQVGRRFEQSLEQLTDNRELLGGIRAFLRMIRESG